MIEHIAEGWTGDLEFSLRANGAIPPEGLPGTPELILKDKDGVVVNTAGKTGVIDAPTWKVRYTPAANDLVAAKSPYTARWKVTNGGKDVFFPSGQADEYRIYVQ